MASIQDLEGPGLILAAKQLRNERLVKIFESFLEQRACVGRAIFQAIVVLWSGAWLYGPQPVLVKDAQAVFPTAVALLIVAIVWMLLVRRRIIPARNWLDAAGFTMSLLFIGIQTWLAFILLISLNAFLPFLTIAAVARYGRKAIRPVLIATFILLLVTAPSGYWLSRPAYFVYAVLLTVVLPYMVARMVTAMQEIAFQAIASRDAQSRFISTMSHELRTPLNAIINCAQLIETDPMPPEQRDLMAAVSVNATALRHRVDEVLDVASIDGGRLRLKSKPLNMLDVMRTVQAVCANQASAKGVTLGFHFESLQTPYLMGDEGRIEQVITNLVTNAVKFTPAGGVVDLTMSAVPEGQDWRVTVVVSDTGIGVPDDKKDTIFMPFMQVSTGSSRVEGGVGLGLFIAASVSHAMQGALTVEDNPGGGSIFRWSFVAPAAVHDNASAVDMRQALAEHRASVRPQHCLVFEDMDTNRLVIANLLTRAGHRVTFHVDGFDAIERIRTAAPDIVFLDLHMPTKSGWDVLQEIRTQIASLPPIVVLTADTRSEAIAEAIDAGVAGYLSKPINAPELLAVLRKNGESNQKP